MNPGKLDRLAQFYALSESLGDGGAPRRVFASPVAVWVGRMKQAAGFPTDSQGARRDDLDTVYLARYNTALAAGGRLRIDGVTHEIIAAVEAPPPANRRAEMHLTCRALPGAQPLNLA